jgi:hypothetical protein
MSNKLEVLSESKVGIAEDGGGVGLSRVFFNEALTPQLWYSRWVSYCSRN